MAMNNYKEMITRLFSREISPQEADEIINSLKQSGEHYQEYCELCKILEDARFYGKPIPPNIDKEWKKLLLRLNLEEVNHKEETSRLTWKKKNYYFTNARFFKQAAVFIAAILLVYGSYLVWQNYFNQPDSVKVATLTGQQKSITLSDASQVHLNTSSELTYPEYFTGPERRVFLTGEAFFKVKGDESRPFVVITPNSQTRVLGTEFNVWARHNTTRVIVKKGRVSLRSTKSNDPEMVILTTGNMSECINDLHPTEAKKVDADQLLGWLKRKIVFYRTPLAEIAAELEAFYDVKITLNNIRSDKHYSVTGAFENQTLDEVLSAICLTLNLDFQALDKKIIIREK